MIRINTGKFNLQVHVITVTEAVDCFGTLNGIEPSQIVTLSGAQEIPGTITFRHLEITEELVVSVLHLSYWMFVVLRFFNKNNAFPGFEGWSKWNYNWTTLGRIFSKSNAT